MAINNNLIIFLALLSSVSCQQKMKRPEMMGIWNLIHIYKDGKDVLKNDEIKRVYNFKSMYIESREIDQLTLEIGREDIYADFRIKQDTLYLSRCTEKVYEGAYLITHKDTVSNFFKSEVTSLTLSHLKKDLIIYGLRPRSNNKE